MKRLLFGLGFALVVLTLAELLLGAVLGRPEPREMHVAPALVEHDQWFTEADGLVTATYQDALLEPEVFPVRADRRIAVLGGSSVHGGTGKVPAREEFATLLAASLDRPVINLGLPGLDTSDHLRILEQLSAYEVETVVLYCCHNDFGNLYFKDHYGGVAPSLVARVQERIERLMLVATVGKLLHRLDPDPLVVGIAPKPGIAPEVVADAVERFEERLHTAAELADQAGQQLVLVTPASALTLPPASKRCDEQPCALERYQAGLDLAGVDPGRGGELLREARDLDAIPVRAPTAAADAARRVAAERDLLLVDAARDLPRATGLDAPDPKLFEDLVHPTATGHAELARLLDAALR